MSNPYRTKYYSIDVEAVATGHDHNSRSVAQISLVDQNEQVCETHTIWRRRRDLRGGD